MSRTATELPTTGQELKTDVMKLLHHTRVWLPGHRPSNRWAGVSALVQVLAPKNSGSYFVHMLLLLLVNKQNEATSASVDPFSRVHAV